MLTDQYGNALTATEYETFLGKQLFGKPSRMMVGLWIARLDVEHADGFYASQYTDWCLKTKRPYGQANLDFDRYENLKMIEVVKIDRAKWYRRVAHPMWDVIRLLDSVMSTLADPEAARAFTMAPENVEQMIWDLQKIHHKTAPEPEPPPSPTVVESKGAARGWPGNYRKRDGRGRLQCSKCKAWKAPKDFSPRPNRPGLYKSHCKACIAEAHRQRYLTLKKVEALNAVGLTFTVTDGDDVVGLSCTDCGQPIEVGQEVAGHTRLWHTACPTI